ncbi:thiamine/thiamine pyrophosphate ABC transporter permease ThiP [Aureimonas sp. SA4125]|uniref:thiamine/thiamine pyrophosphate ABC transporter permease n=1 Tax=Aureimonas sp. SA4125 TaxID=2826993 RepID=UPI001CC4D229|nr:thiamine/thiamine pyrophosphate ABC transporter permease [Aureimonas sp. SA4125]BDA86224.1 thiamine/thiamine pyrophosphate ABC transporter permease ThiP [Aureimonas sp. SA4125]
MIANTDRRWQALAGAAGLLLLGLFVIGAFAALVTQAATIDVGAVLGDPYIAGVVRFTLLQAGLSTLFSLAFALPLALALHRFRFPGRSLVLRFFLLPQALPVLVGALGILAIWGRGGLLSDALAGLGFARLDVYGLTGILLAHVFFNMPLATRLLVAALDAVPSESWKLAGQLSLGPAATFRLVEWPAIRSSLPAAASLVFMLCMTSFTLVLVLGGGPAATTLEVSIYQSLRYAFDPARAVVLALAQVLITGIVLFAVTRFAGRVDGMATLGRAATRYDRMSTAERGLAGLVILLGLGFVLAPFAAIVTRGLAADLWRLFGETALHRAVLTSMLVATAAATLSLALSLALLFGARARRRNAEEAGGRGLYDLAGSLVLVVPPIVLGAGWFLCLRQVTDVFAAAPYLVVATNAVMAMPFVMRIVGPALSSSAARHDRLAESLGLAGLNRLALVEWPATRGALGLAFAFALALSLGDLGVAALFGNQDFLTLPLLLYQRMGSYRTADAAGIALILGIMTLVLMSVGEKGFARKDPE